MKKLLLTLAAVVGFGFAANADSYTITFKANPASSNQGPEIKAATLTTDVIESGADYVASFSDLKQAYAACNYGLKIGANKQAGNITINLSDAGKVTASKIEIYASASKNATYQKLNVNGTEFSFTTADVNASFKVCEITPNAAIDAIVLKKTNASTTSSQQGFVFINKIVVTYSNSGSSLSPAGLKYEETAFDVVLGDDFTAPTLENPNNLDVTYSSSDEAVATVNATTGAVTIVGIGSTTIAAKSAETDKYYAGTASYTINVTKPVTYADVILATAMTDGKYAIYTPQGVAKNYVGSSAFGYLFLEAVTVENNEFKVNEDYLIEFTSTDKGYTMKDSRGMFLGMDATHFGSFNFYSEADATDSNCYWNVTFDGNNVKIENTGRKGAYISYKEYKNDWEITTTDNADQPLVQLYKIKPTSTAIDNIEAADNAPVEYFNLQGIRVANPENGLYIRRQGNKVTKVIVK